MALTRLNIATWYVLPGTYICATAININNRNADTATFWYVQQYFR